MAQGWWIAAAASAASSPAAQEAGGAVQPGWLIAAGVSAVVAAVALVKDRARTRRDESVRGRVPWHLILPLAMLAAFVFVIIGLTGGYDMPGGYFSTPRRF